MTERTLAVARERFALRGVFRISRGSRTHADVVSVTLTEGDIAGRGECVPYARYDETVDGVMATIEALAGAVSDGLTRARLAELLPAGAARNALDCALWDLEAKRSGRPVHELAGVDAPRAVITAYTLSLDAPAAMGEAARVHAARPLLKLKLGGDGEDLARVAAVRAGAPDARLIVDANEAWNASQAREMLPAMAELGVSMVEQPMPAADDTALADMPHPVPVCADESCHTSADPARLLGRYEMVNVKLDKTGGLTEALALVGAARELGLEVMVGCMIGSSLAMAPAMLLTTGASLVDLDAPLLLAEDREPAMRYDEAGCVHPAPRAVWG